MPFLGVQPTDTFASVAKQTITGDGSVTYTLTHSVAGANDLAVFVNNVRQEPTVAYSASGTSITFTEAIASTDDCYVVYIARTFQSVTPDYPLENFSSKGIDDNATSTQITLTNTATTISNSLKPSSVTFTGAGGISWDENIDDIAYDRYGISYGALRLNFTYDGSTIARFLSSGEFELYNDLTVDTDTLVVDSTTNTVGIGASNPSDAGLVINAKGNANTSANVAFKSNVDTYLRVARFGTGADSTITLGNNYNRNSGSFAADNSAYPVHNITFNTDGSMRFGTGAAGSTAPTERMRILSSGGITFNGDTAAANALDDYEEGTCTISFSNGGTNGTFSSIANTTGYYTKIGSVVTVSYYSSSFTVNSAGTGGCNIGGLPFVASNSAAEYHVVTVTHATCFSSQVQNGYVQNNSTYWWPVIEGQVTAPNWATGSGKYLMFSVTYFTDQ